MSFIRECQDKNFGAAEAAIARSLQETVASQEKAKSASSMGGLGAGAVIGTLLLPGVGTVVGGMLGKMFAEGSFSPEFDSLLAWERADLYFSLGMLYGITERKAEARQAWIKALTYKEDHEPSRLALKKVI
jgi:hypothetical protein